MNLPDIFMFHLLSEYEWWNWGLRHNWIFSPYRKHTYKEKLSPRLSSHLDIVIQWSIWPPYLGEYAPTQTSSTLTEQHIHLNMVATRTTIILHRDDSIIWPETRKVYPPQLHHVNLCVFVILLLLLQPEPTTKFTAKKEKNKQYRYLQLCNQPGINGGEHSQTPITPASILLQILHPENLNFTLLWIMS